MNPSPYNPGGAKPTGGGPKSDQTRNIILIIAGVLLLAALGFFAAKYFSTKGDLETKIAQNEELSTEITGLEQKINGLDQEIQRLNTDSQGKDSLIAAKLAEISGLNSRLSSLASNNKVSASKLQELQKKLKNAEAQYQVELDKLKQENAALGAKVEEKVKELVKKDQDIMKKEEELTQTKQEKAQKESELAQTQEEKAQKEKELAQTKQDKEKKEKELDQTKQAASPLKAADFRFLNVKKNDKQKEEYDKSFNTGLFGGINDIRSCFTIQENAVAPVGSRDVYMVYENPDGSTRTTAGSGNFKYNNQSMQYTLKQTINYNRSSQEVCMTIPKPDKSQKYQKGTQKIAVYCDNKLIGTSDLQMK
jgi:myosin heavy subunit